MQDPSPSPLAKVSSGLAAAFGLLTLLTVVGIIAGILGVALAFLLAGVGLVGLLVLAAYGAWKLRKS